ncbi:hypothetical protein [Corynebacterium belfantii]|uniref:hypothetical protein n=1 Tax=Corynebacterium belfantii TaxID=2014537 RepID=UPI001357280E|nr:hypothetical protein [Corynebacterium belfantii]MBG9286737.1 hypothetical protein [Corynebacterium belfantii]MBG9318521.1 hypothetical protein [Corynebacterium belfantii]
MRTRTSIHIWISLNVCGTNFALRFSHELAVARMQTNRPYVGPLDSVRHVGPEQ